MIVCRPPKPVTTAEVLTADDNRRCAFTLFDIIPTHSGRMMIRVRTTVSQWGIHASSIANMPACQHENVEQYVVC